MGRRALLATLPLLSGLGKIPNLISFPITQKYKIFFRKSYILAILESIEKEYKISQELYELPNFIRYFCVIICNDNIKNIINNQKTISDYKMCYYGDKQVGLLVMKEYNLGCIENYVWNNNNTSLLINVIKQDFGIFPKSYFISYNAKI